MTVHLFLKLICGYCLVVALVGCEQNLSTTLYMRDIQDLLTGKETKELPAYLSIEILETGIERQCSTQEGQKLVEAVGSVFAEASLVGCEKISGSMNDRMVIKATTLVTAPDSTSVGPGKYLVHFDVFNLKQNNDLALLTVRFNADKYTALKEKISMINMMTQVKIEDVRISLILNNDLRESKIVFPIFGVFADGEPIDNDSELKLEPRQEVKIQLGDVKLAFLAKYGWAGIANLRINE